MIPKFTTNYYGDNPCGCSTPPVIHPQLPEVFITYDVPVKLSNVGKFTIVDADDSTSTPVVQYDMSVAADRAYVSVRPNNEACGVHVCTASSSGKVVMFQITTKLQGGKTYTINIDSGFAHSVSSVNDEAPGATWSFNTPDTTAPTVVSKSPKAEQTGVAVYQPEFKMTFSENVKLEDGLSAVLFNGDGSRVASLTAKLGTDQKTLKFSVPAGTRLKALTEHHIMVPYGAVTDLSGNKFFGTTLCSGCDWTFTTAHSEAPTIVNAPGALCNNTENPGVVAVNPGVDSVGVLVDTSYITFRWCVPFTTGTETLNYTYTSTETLTNATSGEQYEISNPTLGAKTVAVTTYRTAPVPIPRDKLVEARKTQGDAGYITITNKEGDYTVAGIDLMAVAVDNGTVFTSKSVVSSHDEYRINIASSALKYGTTYTVTIPANSYLSYTMEPNQHYQWDFTTAPAPPPIRLRNTFPVHNTEYNRTKVNKMDVTYDQPLVLGTEGEICFYRNAGEGGGYEKTACVDMTALNTMTIYETSFNSRRNWNHQKQRRGASVVQQTFACTGDCVSTSGPTVSMQLPPSLNLLSDGQRYAGSISQGSVTGAFGQPGPQMSKTQWVWNTNTKLPSSYTGWSGAAAGGAGATAASSSSSAAATPWWVWLLVGLGALIVLGAIVAGIVWGMKDKTKKKGELGVHDFEPLDDEFDEDGDWADLEAELEGSLPGVDSGPGKSGKGYKGPIGPDVVPACDEVAQLDKMIDDVSLQLASLGDKSRDEWDDFITGVALTTDPPKKIAEAGGKSGAPPGGIAIEGTVAGGALLGDIELIKDIEKSDIKAAANSIVAVQKLISPVAAAKVNKWRVRSEMLQGKAVVAKMDSIGEPIPAINAMIHNGWAMSKDSGEGPGNLDFLVAQAWPEVTRLRVERLAKLEHMEISKGLNETSNKTRTIPQFAELILKSKKIGKMLKLESEVLGTAMKLSTIGPLLALTAAPLIAGPEDKDGEGKMQVNPASDMNSDINAIQQMQETGKIQSDAIEIEMGAIATLKAPDKLNLIQGIFDSHEHVIREHTHAENLDHVDPVTALQGTIHQINKLVPDKSQSSYPPETLDALEAVVKEMSPVMIHLHAMNNTVAGPQLEKILVATQRVTDGLSTMYYLQAVIDEVTPQLARIHAKEMETKIVTDILDGMDPILKSHHSPEKKLDGLGKLMEEKLPDLTTALKAHEQRYKAWLHEVPAFDTNQQAGIASMELLALSGVVSTCEAVVMRNNPDMLNSAFSAVNKLYLPTKLVDGDAEKLARCLNAMEIFVCNPNLAVEKYTKMEDVPPCIRCHRPLTGDNPQDMKCEHCENLEVTPEMLEDLRNGIQEGKEPLERLHSDIRCDVAKIRTAFDLMERILNQSTDDPDFFTTCVEPKNLPAKAKCVIFDAWGNISKLQAEKQANVLTENLLQIIAARKSDSLTPDEFATEVLNHRLTLNKLLEANKDLTNEQNLLGALNNLGDINDADAINVAVREAKVQIANIRITEEYTECLKELFKAFGIYLEDRDQGIKLLKQFVQNYSHLEVRLGAMDDDPFPLRSGLILAERCVCDPVTPQKFEIQLLMMGILNPQIIAHTSAPKTRDIEDIMKAAEEVIDMQSKSKTAEDHIKNATKAKSATNNVNEEMDAHRNRLAYRNRLAVQNQSKEEVNLRKAEKTGAEWEFASLEDVTLKKAHQDDPVELMYHTFDLDHDKDVTVAEIVKYIPKVEKKKLPPSIRKLNLFQKKKLLAEVQKADTDNDGSLSFGEFKAWWTSGDETTGSV